MTNLKKDIHLSICTLSDKLPNKKCDFSLKDWLDFNNYCKDCTDATNSFISNVELDGTDLIFTGEGDAFSGTIDLSSLGGSVITGADTQVLFFDGANNPVGDTGLVYNKTTDVLTSGGLTLSGLAGNGVGYAALDNSGILSWTAVPTDSKTTQISSSQILTAFDTPIELIPAVAGKIIIPTIILIKDTFITTPYSGAGTVKTEIRFPSGTSGSSALYYKGLNSWDFTANSFYQFTISSIMTTNPSGIVHYIIEEPLMLYTDIANPSGGNGTREVTVFYKLL